MDIIKVDGTWAERLAPLCADFRAALHSYKGIVSEPDIEAGKEEMEEYIQKGFPVFAAEEGGAPVGYVVCRIDEGCLWVEQLYVRGEYRRKGIASALFDRAEGLAHEMGEETVYNYVHPNNNAVIGFLRSKGYTVLNLIEIRRPYEGESPNATIRVDKHEFDY